MPAKLKSPLVDSRSCRSELERAPQTLLRARATPAQRYDTLRVQPNAVAQHISVTDAGSAQWPLHCTLHNIIQRSAAVRESAPTRTVGCSRSAATQAAREVYAPPNELGSDRFGATMRRGRQFENVSERSREHRTGENSKF